ncbi:hypothetical protein ES703_61317 [subsurface metagenome]
MLEGLQTLIGGIGEDVKSFITEKPIQTAVIGAGVLGAGAIGTAVLVAKKRKKAAKKTKAKRKTARGRRRDIKFISKQKHEQAYIRRKRKAGKKITRKRYKTQSKSKKRTGKIYFTKKGQPYKILASGKARFIKRRK